MLINNRLAADMAAFLASPEEAPAQKAPEKNPRIPLEAAPADGARKEIRGYPYSSPKDS